MNETQNSFYGSLHVCRLTSRCVLQNMLDFHRMLDGIRLILAYRMVLGVTYKLHFCLRSQIIYTLVLVCDDAVAKQLVVYIRSAARHENIMTLPCQLMDQIFGSITLRNMRISNVKALAHESVFIS